MKRSNIKAYDIPDAWYKNLKEIWFNGDMYPVGYGSEETETKKMNVSIEITNPEVRPLTHEKAPCNKKYVDEYALKYLFSDFIEKETYTYGSRLRDPIDQIEEAMKRFLDSYFDRQVTALIRKPEDILKTVTLKEEKKETKHAPPCWTIWDLEILREKDDKLKMNSTSYFRSWDAYAGLPANIAGIQILSESFVNILNGKGRELRKDWEDVSTGAMTFHSKNCHIYERQYKLVEDMFSKGKNKTYMQKIQDSKLPSSSQ